MYTVYTLFSLLRTVGLRPLIRFCMLNVYPSLQTALMELMSRNSSLIATFHRPDLRGLTRTEVMLPGRDQHISAG